MRPLLIPSAVQCFQTKCHTPSLGAVLSLAASALLSQRLAEEARPLCLLLGRVPRGLLLQRLLIAWLCCGLPLATLARPLCIMPQALAFWSGLA